MTVTVIGVPTDSAGRTGGVAGAPAAMRQAGLAVGIAARGGGVIDVGDIRVDPPTGIRGPDGVIDGPVLAATLARTRHEVAAARRRGHKVVLLGGDCPILVGAIAGCRDADDAAPALLFVDGHEDAWPPEASITGEAADMELGWLLGRGLERLDPGLRAQVPRLDPARTAVLGARDRAEILAAGVAPLDELVQVLTDVDVVRDPANAARTALDRIAPDGVPWWLHVDLDVLSTEALPAIDYPQPGGLAWADLRALTAASLDRGACVGATVTIYNPDLDPGGLAAPTIAMFVLDIVDRLGG